MKTIKIILFCFLIPVQSLTQTENDTNLWLQKPSVSFSGFVDAYYFYDFNQPTTAYRQTFLYNHNRHNEFNVNLALVKIAIENPKYSANIAFHAGTYVQDNYASEQNLLKNISEANIGLSISKKNKLWLHVGILPSHIGFESAVSSDNWTLTRSLLAENSPYYMSGAKITYKPNEKWELSGMALNGWQKIKRVSGNSMLSFGTQIKYSKSKNASLNWSTYIGTNDPDTTRRMRYFNNLYGQFQLTKRIGLIGGFDFGFQQNSKHSTKFNSWFSPVIIGQFAIAEKWKLGLRFEYFDDENRVIINVPNLNGFKTFGTSINVDYSPISAFVIRLEGRLFQSQDAIFTNKTSFTNSNFFIGTSLAFKFLEKKRL